jgi:putative Mg2+ transporter-C (MgtC) family protein
MSDLPHFILNLLCALLMGLAIGLERQLRQHPAGLRTNVLVCVGAAMFVSLSLLMHETASPTRMASYVVSGIGFLGGGVILREGMNVRGISTAATLWCTAAIGSLAGSGFPGHAIVGTVTVLAAHLVLRPVSLRIDEYLKTAQSVATLYRIEVVCRAKQRNSLRAVVITELNQNRNMIVRRIATKHGKQMDDAEIVATVFSPEQNDHAIEELMGRIALEPTVVSAKWDRTSTTHE